ncbi:MAG TPA: DUF4384 domain-containing protein [Gemmatimonadales bacterium]|nr:DUF4384 domain-containing protein [Gemmatimonadales bacterium]
MIAALALLVGGLWSVAPVARAGDPPVKLWLSGDGAYDVGDWVRVDVRAAQDGYLVVLRADGDSRLRVLFPLDPGSDNFVRGGDRREIRGRGDRDAFIVDEQGGRGVVVAAWSPAPFQITGFVRGDHWDYAALDTVPLGNDEEAALVDLVQGMTPGHFAFDAVHYAVQSEASYVAPDLGPCFGCTYDPDWWLGAGPVGFAWGYPLGDSFCDWSWGPWGCNAYEPAWGFWPGFWGYAAAPFGFGWESGGYAHFGRGFGRGFGYGGGFGRPWGRPFPHGSGYGNAFVGRVRGGSLGLRAGSALAARPFVLPTTARTLTTRSSLSRVPARQVGRAGTPAWHGYARGGTRGMGGLRGSRPRARGFGGFRGYRGGGARGGYGGGGVRGGGSGGGSRGGMSHGGRGGRR